MKAKERSSWIRVVALSTLFLTSIVSGYGQTQINLATQGRNVDFTNAPYTKPIRSGTSLPAVCSAGEFFLNTSGTAGQNLFACIGTTWTLMSGQAGLPDPGSNGLVKRTGPNTVTAVPAPAGNVVGTTDLQTLTGKSIDASEINSGVLGSGRMPALTGDVTSTSGSTATALSSVMATPGTYGDATHSLQVTVDSKGRVTSLNTLPIITGPTTVFYQQLSSTGTASAPRPTLNLSGAFSVVDNSGSSRTDVDLATVNSNPGTFGSASQIPVITVNAYGQVTSVTTTSSANTNSVNSSPNTVSSLTSGALGAIPSSCSTGNLFFATDQPQGQQIYVCSAQNSWGQFMTVGGSGALAFNNGSLDLVTTVVPRLAAANNFSGLNTFTNGLTLASSGSQPACNTSSRGMFWFLNNGSSRDSLQVCAYSGTSFAWVSLY